MIHWLNESTSTDISFYLVKVEAIRIGDSPYAPLFTPLADPDPQSKQIGEEKKNWADRHYKRFEFWKRLLEKGKEKANLFNNISPRPGHRLSTEAGISGVTFRYEILENTPEVSIYIAHDKDTGEKTKPYLTVSTPKWMQLKRSLGPR